MAIVKKVLYPKNSQFLKITGLKDNSVSPAVYMNAATVTATLKDASGDAVSGFDAVAGTYETGSDGNYTFPVDPTLFDPTPGSDYTLFLEVDQGGKKLHAELPAKVSVRQQGTET
jgi:hypothetical protein